MGVLTCHGGYPRNGTYSRVAENTLDLADAVLHLGALGGPDDDALVLAT